jgi:hypothetical protein
MHVNTVCSIERGAWERDDTFHHREASSMVSLGENKAARSKNFKKNILSLVFVKSMFYGQTMLGSLNNELLSRSELQIH